MTHLLDFQIVALIIETISQIRGEPGTLEERVIKTTTEIQAQKDVQA